MYTLLHPGILCPPPLLIPISPLSWYLRPNQQPISFFPPTTVTLQTRPGTTLTQQFPSRAFNQQQRICVLIKHRTEQPLAVTSLTTPAAPPRMDKLCHIHLCEYHTAMRMSKPGPAAIGRNHKHTGGNHSRFNISPLSIKLKANTELTIPAAPVRRW